MWFPGLLSTPQLLSSPLFWGVSLGRGCEDWGGPRRVPPPPSPSAVLDSLAPLVGSLPPEGFPSPGPMGGGSRLLALGVGRGCMCGPGLLLLWVKLQPGEGRGPAHCPRRRTESIRGAAHRSWSGLHPNHTGPAEQPACPICVVRRGLLWTSSCPRVPAVGVHRRTVFSAPPCCVLSRSVCSTRSALTPSDQAC